METSKVEVTKEQFQDYENVRVGGKTNMLDIRMVEALSDNLDRTTIITIIKTYSELMKKYPDVRKE